MFDEINFIIERDGDELLHIDDVGDNHQLFAFIFIVVALFMGFTTKRNGPNSRQLRYGKVFKTFVLGRFTIFMSGREASKILLTGKDGIVRLNLFYTGKQVLGPTSLLQTSGDAHKRLRRLIAEPLSVDGLKKYFQFMNRLAIQTLDQWPGRTVFVLEEASTVES
ncbi:hypothetical protein LWI28_008407 [Acer negundo]|uniref:Cytochrome P450 n=1 Tax=Acer negundo TaxID=4023 RepID=A0AAD5JIH2_ACENE|nr:hypothetical protein LWI28_008407 [Acer negundo]